MEINFVFNSQKTYYNDFLEEIKSKLVKVQKLNVSEEDFLQYSRGEMDVLIDNIGTVYITFNQNNLKSLDQLVIEAADEYHFLSLIEKKFSKETELKIFLPKTNYFKDIIQYKDFSFNPLLLERDVALTMSLNK